MAKHLDKWILLALAALLLPAAIVLWLVAGWRIPSLDAPSVSGGFPVGGVAALVVGLASAVCLVLSGYPLLRFVQPRARRLLPALVFSFLAGGAFSGIVLGLLGFVYIGPGALFLPLALAWGFAIWRGWRPPSLQWRGLSPWWLAVAPFLLLMGLAALAPLVESDGLRYHVPAPRAWVRAGHFVSLPFNANSNLPALQGLLATSLAGQLQLGRVFQILHWLHFAALVVVAGELGGAAFRSLCAYRAGVPSKSTIRAARGISALLVAGIPAAGILASWPFADLAAAAYLFAGIWVLVPGTIRGAKARGALGGLLLGAAVAAKISILPLAAIAGVYASGRIVFGAGREKSARAALLIMAGTLVIAPWLVKNVLAHGNPVYPLGWSVFGGVEWSAANEEFYRAKMAEKGLGDGLDAFVASPFQMTVNWPAFESFNPGPGLLALLPFALAGCLYAILFKRGGFFGSAVCLLGAVFLLGWPLWFGTYQSARFFLPQQIALEILGAAFLFSLAIRLVPAVQHAVAVLLLAVAASGLVWPPVYHLRADHAYAAALGGIDEDVYIARRLNSYPAIQWLNQEADGGRVYYIGEFRMAYARNYTPVASDWFDTPRVLVDIRATADNTELFRLWRQNGIDYVLLNLSELQRYAQAYFRPRFSEEEWRRFEGLLEQLLENTVYDTGSGVSVARVPAIG